MGRLPEHHEYEYDYRVELGNGFYGRVTYEHRKSARYSPENGAKRRSSFKKQGVNKRIAKNREENERRGYVIEVGKRDNKGHNHHQYRDYPRVSISESSQGFHPFVEASHLFVDFLVEQVVQNRRSSGA